MDEIPYPDAYGSARSFQMTPPSCLEGGEGRHIDVAAEQRVEPSGREKLATLRFARSVGGPIVPVATKLGILMRPFTNITRGISSSELCIEKYIESILHLSSL